MLTWVLSLQGKQWVGSHAFLESNLLPSCKYAHWRRQRGEWKLIFKPLKGAIMKRKEQRSWGDDEGAIIWVVPNQRAWDIDTDSLAWVEF